MRGYASGDESADTDASTRSPGAASESQEPVFANGARCPVVVVASVGNDSAPHDPVEYPAALLQPVGSNGNGGAGLAVTASTQDGRRAPFANTGTWISLAAPGVHVLGALSQLSSPLLYPRVAAPAGKGLYGYASGTSFAAPLVAGAAALVWAANPALTAQQVAQILKQTASGGGRWSPDLGFGVVDVAAAVAQAPLGPSGVLVGGMRDGTRERMTRSGTASPYTLTVARDGRTARTILAATPRTSETVDAAHGHTYVFTVTDGSGASATLTLRP